MVQPGVDRLPALLEQLRVRGRGQRRHTAQEPELSTNLIKLEILGDSSALNL